MDFLKNLIKSAPKTIMGSAGKYFRLGTHPQYELYVKVAFTPKTVGNTVGNTCTAFCIETNVLLVPVASLDEEPLLAEGMSAMRSGLYRDTKNNVLKGVLIQKLILPTAITNLNTPALHQALALYAPKINDYLSKAMSFMGVETVFGFTDLVTLLADDLKDDIPGVESKLYTLAEFEECQKKWKTASAAKFNPPVETGQPQADDDNDLPKE